MAQIVLLLFRILASACVCKCVLGLTNALLEAKCITFLMWILECRSASIIIVKL